jgi:hypothetical protein
LLLVLHKIHPFAGGCLSLFLAFCKGHPMDGMG